VVYEAVKDVVEVREKLQSLKNFMRGKIPDFSFFPPGSDIVDSMRVLLKWQIPKTSHYTIATTNKKVLNLFDIDIEHEAIYQRMKREKRKQDEEMIIEIEKADLSGEPRIGDWFGF